MSLTLSETERGTGSVAWLESYKLANWNVTTE